MTPSSPLASSREESDERHEALKSPDTRVNAELGLSKLDLGITREIIKLAGLKYSSLMKSALRLIPTRTLSRIKAVTWEPVPPAETRTRRHRTRANDVDRASWVRIMDPGAGVRAAAGGTACCDAWPNSAFGAYRFAYVRV